MQKKSGSGDWVRRYGNIATFLFQDNARRLVRSAVANCRQPGRVSADAEVVVRVNGVESGMLHQDLDALFGGGSHDPSSPSRDYKSGSPDAIMLPKVESVEHLLEVSYGSVL